jgi:cell division protein FtsW
MTTTTRRPTDKTRTGSRAVTSITEIRAAVKNREAKVNATNRLVTTLLLVVAALIVIGMAATISATSTVALREDSARWYYMQRQLLGLGMGTIGLLLAAKVPMAWYRKASFPLFVVTLGLLILVLRIGYKAGGATSWINLGPVNFQPTELAKFSVILALAAVLDRKRRALDDLGHYLAPVAAYVGVVAFLVMLQGDLGGVIIVGSCAIAVMVVSTAPLRYVFGTGVGGALIALIVASRSAERWSRITSFLDPWADPLGDSFQLIQGYVALGTGGIFGTGLGNSRARWFYLPNAHTDFIFAIIGEETGLIGGILVLALFALLAVIGVTIAFRCIDPFSRMVASGITVWLSFQAVVNIGGVLGMLPITGVTLPFVSYGGTSLAISMAAVGVLVNIATSASAAKSRRRSPA